MREKKTFMNNKKIYKSFIRTNHCNLFIYDHMIYIFQRQFLKKTTIENITNSNISLSMQKNSTFIIPSNKKPNGFPFF